MGQPKGCAPPELKLTLASLQAPRLALKPATMSSTYLTTQDQEAFAWQSREFLRSACVGKQVYFKVEYTVQSIGRHFGAVYLVQKSETDLFVGPTSHKMSENICLTAAREGWCTVRSRSKEGSSEKSGDYDKLVELNKEAEQSQKGVYNTKGASDSIRTVKWDFLSSKESSGESDVMSLYSKIKNKPQRALVEYIRDGSSIKALLLDSMTLITFNLAGVQCPRMNMSAKQNDGLSGPQEYAQEAKFFTEVRLLNREVMLKIGGINEKYTTFFGSVVHPKNTMNIAVELVRNGLAQPVDWSMSFTTPSAAASIYQSVLAAKKSKLRLWKSYQAPKIPGEQSFVGIVSEIVSGDSFTVRVGSEEQLKLQPWQCKEVKLHLSSIRAPRVSRQDDDEPLARESREFLRTRLIGKQVSVNVEYVIGGEAQAKSQSVVRKYATVILLTKQPTNVAALLLENGLATLMGHKQGAERSQFYHELITAEKKAQDINVGLWNKTNGKSDDKKPLDLNTPLLAKSHLSSLKNERYEKTIPGIVDYVFNGGRLKLLIPSLNVKLTFNLSGVSCGRTGKQKKKEETDLLGEEALAFTRAAVLQKNVEVLVESVDKGGNFIGTIFFRSTFEAIGKASGRENLAILLLRQGLAITNPVGIRYAKFAEFLVKEEDEARESKSGLWLTYVAPVVEEAKEAEEAVVKSTDTEMPKISVTVSHITSANNFYVHIGSEKEKYEKLTAYLDEYTEKNGAEADETSTETFKKNEQVLALYNDGSRPKWYRANVIAVVREEKVTYTVRYSDFGNSETVAASRLKKVDDETLKIPPLARQTTLAFIKAPQLAVEYGTDAAMYLSQLTRGKTLKALVHAKEKTGALVLTLLPAGKSQEKTDAKEEEQELVTINGLLLREGLATIPRKARLYLKGAVGRHEKTVKKHMEEQQEMAHSSRSNLWSYGDPREDEEER